jgi:hypothetical protein
MREMTPNQYQQSAEGIVTKIVDGSRPATQEEFNARHSYQRGLVDVAFKNLDDYIRDTYRVCTSLELYKPLGVGCCTGCGSIECSCIDKTSDDGELDFFIA